MLYLKETLILYMSCICQVYYSDAAHMIPSLTQPWTYAFIIHRYIWTISWFSDSIKKETKCTHQLVDLGEEDLLIQGNNRKVREELKGGLFFRGGHFWRAKSKKMAKNFLKIYCSKIIYIPIKAILSMFVSRKNTKNDKNGHFQPK